MLIVAGSYSLFTTIPWLIKIKEDTRRHFIVATSKLVNTLGS